MVKKWSTCASGVPSLYHEIFNNSVELYAIVVAPTSEFGKVSAGVWSMSPVEFYNHITHPETQGKHSAGVWSMSPVQFNNHMTHPETQGKVSAGVWSM